MEWHIHFEGRERFFFRDAARNAAAHDRSSHAASSSRSSRTSVGTSCYFIGEPIGAKGDAFRSMNGATHSSSVLK